MIFGERDARPSWVRFAKARGNEPRIPRTARVGTDQKRIIYGQSELKSLETPKIAQRFIAGVIVRKCSEFLEGWKNLVWFFAVSLRPDGDWSALHPYPTVEAVGDCRASLAGLRNPRNLWFKFTARIRFYPWSRKACLIGGVILSQQ